jgi:hypothetical protein
LAHPRVKLNGQLQSELAKWYHPTLDVVCCGSHGDDARKAGPSAVIIWKLLSAGLAMIVCVGLVVKRLRLWFLISGFSGVLVALVLMILGPHHIVGPKILLTLWPSSIAGIADPSTLSDKIVVALFEFGGNFILYGAAGTVIGLCFHRKPRSEGFEAR